MTNKDLKMHVLSDLAQFYLQMCGYHQSQSEVTWFSCSENDFFLPQVLRRTFKISRRPWLAWVRGCRLKTKLGAMVRPRLRPETAGMGSGNQVTLSAWKIDGCATYWLLHKEFYPHLLVNQWTVLELLRKNRIRKDHLFLSHEVMHAIRLYAAHSLLVDVVSRPQLSTANPSECPVTWLAIEFYHF